MLPFTHIDAQWRRAALGDSSLWTTISLKRTTPPLFDMILKCAGNRLFTVYVDHRGLNRVAKLWGLVHRIKELHYSIRLGQLAPFLSSLGPAPNLKALHLRPEVRVGVEQPTSVRLPTIFSGRLPSLRDLTLTNMATWPTGLFRGLVSFECGTYDHFPVSPVHVLDVLRESPSIEFLRVVGYYALPEEFHPPAVTLPSLEKCTLIGQGIAPLIRFMTIPASTLVFLSNPYDSEVIFPTFDHLSMAPNLRVLDEVSAVSLSVSDLAVRLQATNPHGGAVDAEEYELYHLSRDPAIFTNFIRSSFKCGRTFPCFKTTKAFTLEVDRQRMWDPEEATCFALTILGFISNLPGIEEVELRGVPSLDLSPMLESLYSAARSELLCPNLRQLHIESTPVRSPRPFLVELSRLLAERKEAGAPFQSVTVMVKCEALIPAPEHRTLLTSWRGLVGEVVRLEYEQTEVNKLSRRRHRNCDSEDEWDSEREERREWGEDEDEEDESDYEEDEDDTGDPDDGCVGWDGWPKGWPKTVE